MRSFWAVPASPSYSAKIHPALTSFADECRGMLVRLVAYVGALALLAILGMVLWDQIPAELAEEPAAKPGWSPASLSYPAFAVSQFDLTEKTATYEVLRHPEGGRKDILRWAAEGEKQVAELEIYRPGRRIRPIAADSDRICHANRPQGRRRVGNGRGHRQQVRRRDAASACGRGRWPALLPQLHQAV
jgi:hypothetical protein